MAPRRGLVSDPLWYKDAVIYELRVRSYMDSNGDGIGDFRGLTEKLDYLQDLGVSALWLLPICPSPGKDDGYDISDYTDVHPDVGTLEDFKVFLDQAHRRGIRVITELVLNHTSDQHPLRAVQLVLGPHRQAVLLASLLRPPARPQFRQSRRARHDARRRRFLVRPRRRRAAARRGALPLRARRHQLREPPRDAPVPQEGPRAHRQPLQEPHATGGGEPVAGRRRRLLRQRRRMPDEFPLPDHAAHLHVHPHGGPAPDRGHPGADPCHPSQLPMGAVPAQPRRAHAGDGDRRGARLHVPRLRARADHADQPRHPPAPRAAGRQRSAPDRADERALDVVAGDAGPDWYCRSSSIPSTTTSRSTWRPSRAIRTRCSGGPSG
ncbi:MAG: hypothetical protein E6J62_21485 [Deltaproteobacteria bacterium]|nr:MAG: hypothetical protein E6J62_21485 [Deltaproteobacteria bacterium]